MKIKIYKTAQTPHTARFALRRRQSAPTELRKTAIRREPFVRFLGRHSRGFRLWDEDTKTRA